MHVIYDIIRQYRVFFYWPWENGKSFNLPSGAAEVAGNSTSTSRGTARCTLLKRLVKKLAHGFSASLKQQGPRAQRALNSKAWSALDPRGAASRLEINSQNIPKTATNL